MKPDLLTKFLQMLEADPNTAFGIDDLDHASSANQICLEKTGMLNLSQYRKWVICSECGDSHFCEVHWMRYEGSKSIAFYECANDLSVGRVFIDPKALLTYRVSFENFAANLAKHACPSDSPATIISGCLIKLGQFAFADGSVQLFVARPAYGEAIKSLALTSSRLTNSAVLTTPSLHLSQLPSTSTYVPLANVLRFYEGDLVMDTLQLRRDIAAALTPVAATGNIFRRTGDYWTVLYAGRSIQLRSSKGAHYIALLLSQPGVEIPALKLRLTVDKPAATLISGDLEDILDVTDGGAPSFDDVANDYITDTDTLSMIRKEIERLTKVQERAQLLGLTREERDAAEKLSMARMLLSSSTTNRGAPRRIRDANEAARISVSRAIKRAMFTLSAEHPVLYKHLNLSLSLGATLSYSQEISWETD